MSISKFKYLLRTVGLIMLIMMSCEEENPEAFIDELPLPAPFEVYLNLSLVSNQSLQNEKRLYLDDVGLKGVVVVKRGENDYVAFERKCPFTTEDDCYKIYLDASTLFLVCGCQDPQNFDEYFYNLEGFPTGQNIKSPRKLREYRTQLSGNNLIVDSTIL